jgi:hypothetical protein
MKRATKQAIPYPLRLDPELSQWVKDRAKAGDRSLNAEINRLIRQAKEGEEEQQKAKSA